MGSMGSGTPMPVLWVGRTFLSASHDTGMEIVCVNVLSLLHPALARRTSPSQNQSRSNKEGSMKRLLSSVAVGLLACLCLAPDEAKDPKPGLLGTYYDMGDAVEDFPDIPADKKPTIKLIDKQLNFDSTSEELGNSKL